MRQFDICRNPGRTRDGFPYFLIVQSNEFEALPRRLVVPLAARPDRYPEIAPKVAVRGKPHVADALLLFSLAADRLGPVVGRLEDEAAQDRVLDATRRVVARR
jgi:hypothetical protein